VQKPLQDLLPAVECCVTSASNAGLQLKVVLGDFKELSNSTKKNTEAIVVGAIVAVWQNSLYIQG
jgi:hypothetical protein